MLLRRGAKGKSVSACQGTKGLMKQGEYLKQQILFVNWQMCSVIPQKWHLFMWKCCMKLQFKWNEISFLHHQCGHQKSKCRSLSQDERIYCSTAICVSGLLYICKTLLCHQKNCNGDNFIRRVETRVMNKIVDTTLFSSHWIMLMTAQIITSNSAIRSQLFWTGHKLKINVLISCDRSFWHRQLHLSLFAPRKHWKTDNALQNHSFVNFK